MYIPLVNPSYCLALPFLFDIHVYSGICRLLNVDDGKRQLWMNIIRRCIGACRQQTATDENTDVEVNIINFKLNF